MKTLADLMAARERIKSKLKEIETRIELESLGVIEDMRAQGVDTLDTEYGTFTLKRSKSLTRKPDVDVVGYIKEVFPDLIREDFNTNSLKTRIGRGIPTGFDEYFEVNDVEKITLK